MKIVYGDLFEVCAYGYDAIGIPMNGETNNSGMAIMDGAVARRAAQVFGEWTREFLGARLDRKGNHVHVIDVHENRQVGRVVASPQHIFSFPTRHLADDKKADIELIEQSAEELRLEIIARGWRRVCMPEPGTGAGGLSWAVVSLPLMERFGDELTIVRLPKKP